MLIMLDIGASCMEQSCIIFFLPVYSVMFQVFELLGMCLFCWLVI